MRTNLYDIIQKEPTYDRACGLTNVLEGGMQEIRYWYKPKKYKSVCGGSTFIKPAGHGFRIGGKPYFKPAKNFGIGGGGIAHKLPNTGLIDRYRPDNHKPFGMHINLETIKPLGKKRKKRLGNIHMKY